MSQDYRFTQTKQELLDKLAINTNISDKVLDALYSVPRELFVAKDMIDKSYEDKALPFMCGQTISQPYTVGYMTDALKVKPGDKILEIGAGSGYQAAVLNALGAEVYTIERIKPIFLKTKELLNELNIDVNIFWGDGTLGLPEYAPYDSIIITAAGNKPLKKLMYQLKIGGRMVAPIGDRESQTMFVFLRKGENKFAYKKLDKFKFVPLLEGTVGDNK